MKLRKTTATILIAILVISAMVLVIPAIAKKGGTTIQDGILEYSEGHYLEGETLKVGYDIFGYNYQAHLYNGYYCNVYLGRDGFPPYLGDTDAYLAENPDAEKHRTWQWRDVWVNMKWSDAWLSNMDRDDDGLLDRGYTKDSEGPYTNSAVEGAWETNHQSGVNEDGTHWIYFVKIVYPGDDAVLDEGVYYTPDGVEIGTALWGAYARILQISNDPAYDEHGVLYNPAGPTGFGYYNEPELQIYNPRVRSNIYYNTEYPEDLNYRLLFNVWVRGVKNYNKIDYVKVTYPDATVEYLMDEGEGWGYHPADDGEYFAVVNVDDPISGEFTFEVSDKQGNMAQISTTFDEWLPIFDWVSPASEAELKAGELTEFDWEITVEEPIIIASYEIRLGRDPYDKNEGFWRNYTTAAPLSYEGPTLPYLNHYGDYFWFISADSETGSSVHAFTNFEINP